MVFEGKENVYNTQRNEILVNCSCGTHMFKIASFADDEEIYFELWSENFYNKQKSPLYSRIWNRLKLIWFAISGKEYRLEDFILTKSDVDNLINALQNIQKEKQEVKE